MFKTAGVAGLSGLEFSRTDADNDDRGGLSGQVAIVWSRIVTPAA